MSNELLDDIYAFLGRFIAHPSDDDRVAHTLWIVHTHLMDEWENTPRLAFLSPEPASGKTRALEITELLVPRPVNSMNATPAYLFRRVSDKTGLPTILFDEIDTVFGPHTKKDNEELRGLINAGHRRGATAGRCVSRGNDIATEDFPAYSAVGLAGLGDLPDTILTRSVVIRMRKRKQDEAVEAYRKRLHAPEGEALRDRIAVWAETQKGQLADVFPTMPEGVDDRNADVWEPLLAVADAAGGNWPERARVAAVALVAHSRRDAGGSLGVRLLSDLRLVFESVDKLHTTTILEQLTSLPEAPWKSIKGEPISDRLLANLLKPYGVSSKDVKIEGVVRKGYGRTDLVDAWERYLPPPPPPQEALPTLPELPSPSFDFSPPAPANDNQKPSFDEWRDMSRVEQDALHAKLRKQPNF